MKIAVLGAGAYGTALGGVLTKNGHTVGYYDPGVGEDSLGDALEGAEMMLLCVPSEAAEGLLKELPKDKPLIVATKGFLNGEPFREFEDWMVISGAAFAEDIKRGNRELTLTATDKRVAELFETERLKIELVKDKGAVLLCGALKNVYAILAGCMDYNSFGREGPDSKDEVTQFFIGVIDELTRILEYEDMDSDTINRSCGAEDLLMSCDARSRNYRFGLKKYALGPDYSADETVEGMATIRRIRAGGTFEVPGFATYLQKVMKLTEKWK